MASVNQATVIGFVGDEPKIINTDRGSKIASLSIATTERGFTAKDGTVIPDKTEWHNVVAFGKLAEVIERFVHKGASLYIQGKMRTRSYDDKNNIKRYVTEIHTETLQLLDRKSDNASSNPAGVQQGYQQAPGNYPGGNDSDLPF